jgi:uncharacterized protein (DUF2147 family)
MAFLEMIADENASLWATFQALAAQLSFRLHQHRGLGIAMGIRRAAMTAFWLSTLALAMIGPGTIARALAADPLGTWYTEGNESQIRITNCGGALCGALVWLREPNDPVTHRPKIDSENTDPKLAKRPLVGVQIVLGMRPTGTPNEWKGKVYNAKDGNTYTGFFTMTGADTAILKGCALGFICKSQTWTRAR